MHCVGKTGLPSLQAPGLEERFPCTLGGKAKLATSKGVRGEEWWLPLSCLLCPGEEVGSLLGECHLWGDYPAPEWWASRTLSCFLGRSVGRHVYPMCPSTLQPVGVRGGHAAPKDRDGVSLQVPGPKLRPWEQGLCAPVRAKPQREEEEERRGEEGLLRAVHSRFQPRRAPS